jgi:glycerol-3-phosphate cytidylyltransferase
MRTILTYGTFDVLHIGHVNLLRRARALGDRLVVGLSTDAFNADKHKSSLLDYDNRRVVLEAMRYVDLVIAETSWEQKVADIREHDVDVFVMGSDWEGKFDFLREHCEVVYLPRTADISSTSVKHDLLRRAPPAEEDSGRRGRPG